MKLKNIVKLQLYIMIRKSNFRISFTAMMLYALGTYLLNIYASLGMDVSATWTASSLFVLNDTGTYYRHFENLFPFLVLFPYSFSYLDDKKTKMGILIQTKMGSKYYYFSQMITCFMGSMVLIFIPLLLNLILTCITFSENGNTYFGIYNTYGYCSKLLGTNVVINAIHSGMPFLKVYLASPILYNILYTTFVSLFSGLIGIFGLACSFYIKKHKVTLFAITYLLFLSGSIIDRTSYSSGTYLNTNFLDYTSINTIMGKSFLFFTFFCSFLFIFSITKAQHMIHSDQI